jgi:hypothetical protein
MEGIHELKAIAKKESNSLTAETVISFEIDTVPPPEPEITGVEPGKTYNGGVTVYTLEENGVEYSAQIDDKVYSFGDAYDIEGEHILRVYARKKRNGLTSTLEVPFAIYGDRYSQAEIDYFVEIAFGSEFGGDSERIVKWVKDIRISVTGDPAQSDGDALIQVIDELNELIDTVELSLSEDDPNIEIYFVPHGEFTVYIDPELARNNWGLFTYYENDGGEIESARILIATDKGNEAERAHLIREELTQALGLAQDSWRYVDSIFYQGWTTVNEYDEIDRRIIKMLYNPEIMPNMEKSKVKAYFEAKEADTNDRVQVFPKDQGHENEAFMQFRRELLERLEAKDLEYILAHVDDDFSYHPTGPTGVQAFREYFDLNADPALSTVWQSLKDSLLLGGVFLNPEKTIFETPYIKSRFPDGYDPNIYKAAIEGRIPIYEEPDTTSKTAGFLRFDIVRCLPYTSQQMLQYGAASDGETEWEYIETLSGVRGYVQSAYLRRPYTNTITLEQKGGMWLITSISF